AFSSTGVAGVVSSNVTVSAGPANRLGILTQPSSNAVAGVAFVQQPVIRIEDQFGNLCSSDSSSMVTATRSSGTGTLQGTNSVKAIGGLVSFVNLSYPIAETMNILFSAGSLSNAASANVVVSPGPFTKLQLLVPGESAAPATVSGKTGTAN